MDTSEINTNDKVYNGYTGHPSIPESIYENLKPSILKIKAENETGSGFVIKIPKKGRAVYYLFSCEHIIKIELILSQKSIEILFGKDDKLIANLKLDTNERFIKCFKDLDVTVIEVDKKILPNNFNYLYPDFNYRNGNDIYLDKDCFLAGNKLGKVRMERNISSGQIKNILKYNRFYHTCDTSEGSSGSPICSADYLSVIGIHSQNDKKMQLNVGVFIGKIIEELGGNEIKFMNSISLDYDNESSFKKYCFLEEYKKEFSYLNEKISECYPNQNIENYYKAFEELNKKKIDNNFQETLKMFKKIDYDALKFIFKDKSKFVRFINKYIRSEDKVLSERLSYFNARISKALEKDYGIKKDCVLYRGDKMSYNELTKLYNNINEKIFYKGFMSASFYKGIASIYTRSDDLYAVIIKIIYKYKENWIPNCFDISKLKDYEEQGKVLFKAFSCFKIKKVDINEKEKMADIELELLGKEEREEIEKKLA